MMGSPDLPLAKCSAWLPFKGKVILGGNCPSGLPQLACFGMWLKQSGLCGPHLTLVTISPVQGGVR